MAFAIEVLKEHIGDFAGQPTPLERSPLGRKALSSYVEVTSFELIPFSAFWANGDG
jgi:hypothetical protein